ncbi:Uu.00g008610.m01.CDS01 [Anthostomella pinea]|uniref:Uu.00g008610.m01.CDS01 n=1 Tax=Anthostomella pinea TaxID=933095 RepID=A0AAI8VX69_9PEZI|nr:Uu.00g008610.m01.CDS01 [Anthostomella pinea]
MPRPVAIARPPSVCQICDSLSAQRVRSAKPIFTARNVYTLQGRTRQDVMTRKLVGRRLLSSAVLPSGTTSTERNDIGNTGEDRSHAAARTPPTAGRELSSITNMITFLERSSDRVLTNRDIPPEADVSAALRACRILADYIMDDSVQPQIAHMVSELDSTASTLLSLDATKPSQASTSSETAGTRISTQLQQMIDKISDTAYTVLAHQPVFITPSLLEQYVGVQARLGKPETLPRMFQLYASKPMPIEGVRPPKYVKQNPNKIANAIDSKVSKAALDTAIEAKHLDAAVGIIENTYTTKAFVRNKLTRQALLPLGAFAATPLAAYGLAKSFSGVQQAMDTAYATNVAFAGIVAYVGFTASIGFVALTTANDQMKRVTWAPGVPLRKRWIREEERAAFDKIACAWGFKEKWRQGEEEGPEWDALREYIGQKGMVLDRTELMEGME